MAASSPHIIIDAYNLIHRAKDLREILEQDLERSRTALLTRLETYRRKKQVQITVVFDGDTVGDRPVRTISGLHVIFSRNPEKADPIIKNMVRRSKRRGSILVVSSDRSVADYARSMGARSMPSEEFYQRFLSFEQNNPLSEKYDQNLTESELKVWMDLFNSSQSSPEDDT
ncbi:MAG: NYN domain-containing protein [Calditrichaeota bacterium]|nr:NYN domain-containing protein [Calditrichota bacterium]